MHSDDYPERLILVLAELAEGRAPREIGKCRSARIQSMMQRRNERTHRPQS